MRDRMQADRRKWAHLSVKIENQVTCWAIEQERQSLKHNLPYKNASLYR